VIVTSSMETSIGCGSYGDFSIRNGRIMLARIPGRQASLSPAVRMIDSWLRRYLRSPRITIPTAEFLQCYRFKS
jgi:hypothetical protein